MARYQKIKEVSGWDVLDDFYKRKIRGINLNAFGFTRSFCRCGSVTDQFRDKCSNCDNFDFLEWTAGWENTYICDSENFFQKETIGTKEKLILGQKVLLLETDDKKEKAIFSIVVDNRLIVTKDSLEKLDSIVRVKGYGGWYYRDNFYSDGFVDNTLEQEYKYWDEYKCAIKLLGEKTLEALETSMTLYDKYNNFIDDSKLFQYPSLANLMAKDISHLKNSSVEDNIKAHNIPKEYMPALDYNCKLKNIHQFDELIARKGGYGEDYSFHNTITKIKNKQLNGFESLLKHYFVSNLIDWIELRDIVRQLRTVYDTSRDMDGFDSGWCYYKPARYSYYSSYSKNTSFRDFFDISYMQYFEIFFKENIMNQRANVVQGFIGQVKQMQDLKIPFNEDNFKLKNFNFLLNQKTLSEKYKLPEGKVDMFLDMFEVNPLESLELIKNRRKMTKKELEAFLEVMIKTS